MAAARQVPSAMSNIAKCVSAPLKPGWWKFTTVVGTSAGGLSALTGLGGAVIFVPGCKQLGMTAKKIIGTSVVAVTCATTAGSIAYMQNNVTDIPAAVATGAVGAASTPFGQMIAKGVSGKTLRMWCGVALLACAPTAFMTKKKHESTQDADHIPGDISETRAGGAAALALAGKADELVAKGGILSYLKSRSSAAMAPAAASAATPDEKPTPTTPDAPTHSGSAYENTINQFQERLDAAGGDYWQALLNEKENLLLGISVGLLQGTVGIGGGVLVTTYMSVFTDMEVHRICATALMATLVTNTAVCTHHFVNGNVRLRVAAVLGVSAMAASYLTAKNVSLAVPEPVIRGFIAAALVASGVSMFR
mmetsp:Transcript_12443/g.57613  ORF Transcript_12443/g.57613 Transcript_12443/m.57613 type:complete len:364 (-) Transcript_12443:221-1312(-)